MSLVGFLGTPLLIGLFVLGFLEKPLWWVLIATPIYAFVGLHHPPEKAQAARERGFYWRIYFGSLPLMTLFCLFVFGIGYFIGWIF